MVRQCACKSYQKASVVEEHHVYKVIWIAEVGEKLLVLANSEYGSNKHAVVVVNNGKFFSHLPTTILATSPAFSSRVPVFI